MKKCFLLFAFLSCTSPLFAIDAVYLGGQVGYVSLTGDPAKNFPNAIGFGADLGLRTNAFVDIVLSFQTSSHSGLTAYAPFLSADIHLGQLHDFDFIVGAGPGFYFFKTSSGTDSNFGINVGGAIDAVVDDSIRIGLGSRYHAVFNGNRGGSYWTVMMRLGYLFQS